MRTLITLLFFIFSYMTVSSQIDARQLTNTGYPAENTISQNLKGTIYATDSVYNYLGPDSASLSVFRRFYYIHDRFGKTLNIIIQYYDSTNSSWTNRDSTNYTYYQNGNLLSSDNYKWDTVTNNWTDTISFFALTRSGKVLKYFYRSWDMSSQSFYYGMKVEYQYNPAERVVLYLYQNLINGNWQNNTRIFYDYTDDTILNYIIKQRWINSRWVNDSRNTYLYNAAGKLLNKNTQIWDSTNGTWENISRETWIYRNDTLILDYIYQYWDDSLNTFVNDSRDSFYYSQNYDTTADISMNWDNSTNSWIPSYNEWIFYQNSKMVKKLNQQYDNTTGNWLNIRQHIFEYSGDKYSRILKQNWDSGINDWVNYTQELFTYEPIWGKIKSELTQQWNQTLSQWDTLYYTNYEYNSDGNPISVIYYSKINGNIIPTYKNYSVYIPGTNYITDAWDYSYFSNTPWLYRKFYYTQIITELNQNPKDLFVYPNPAKNVLQISGLNALHAKAEIFDIYGKILQTSSITGNTIDISNLSPGIYFIRITDGTNIHTFKCIKQ